MKVMNKMFLVGAVITSFAPHAEVELEFHRDISPIIVGGEELGFSLFSDNDYTVPNGVNQVVIQVSKLVEKQGEKEKYNSKAFVLTFDAMDTSLSFAPSINITRTKQAEEFNSKPSFIVKDANGRSVKTDTALLPASSGLTRDYEKELAKFNAKYYPELTNATVAAAATQSKPVQQEAKEVVKPNSKQQDMFSYWLEQASSQEIEQFTELAFDARGKKEVIVPKDASQPLQMLGYWFNKSSQQERKQILSHLVSL